MASFKSNQISRLSTIVMILCIFSQSHSRDEAVQYPCKHNCNPITNATSKVDSIDVWGVTKINVKKVTYSWSITNFLYHCKEMGEPIESPIIYVDNGYQWEIVLYPSGSQDKRYSALFLRLLSTKDDKPVTVTCKFSIIDRRNGKLLYTVDSYTVSLMSPDMNWGFNKLMLKRDLEKLVIDDTLTIVAEIGVKIGNSNASGSCDLKVLDYDHADNFESLLENELFSDVTLRVDHYEFRAHRAILASVSPFFKEELLNSQIYGKPFLVLKNLNIDHFQMVLHFIYTGKIDNVEKVAEYLLPVAKKLRIERLINICELALCQRLNTNNALSIYHLAVNVNATYLKTQAFNYIKAHPDGVADSPTFSSLISRPLINYHTSATVS